MRERTGHSPHSNKKKRKEERERGREKDIGHSPQRGDGGQVLIQKVGQGSDVVLADEQLGALFEVLLVLEHGALHLVLLHTSHQRGW